jgi:hypothetical protein
MYSGIDTPVKTQQEFSNKVDYSLNIYTGKQPQLGHFYPIPGKNPCVDKPK